MKRTTILLLIITLILAACGEDEAPDLTATTGSVAVPTEAAAAVVPTDTPAAAATATLAPPPTLAAPPTLTPVLPDPTATTAPIEAINLVTLADFGTDRNPLTGLIVDDPANLQRRPLAIKISNSPPSYVRPQSGLMDADMVWEHITEGLITRFTMIVYGSTPPNVGPIRSARLIDLELPAMFDAALVYSGASVGVSRKLTSSDFASRIYYSWYPGYYRTGENKPYEHTLYGRPEEFWAGLEERDLNMPPNFATNMQFSSLPPEGGEPATGVTIDYQWEMMEWQYDPETNRYFRWSGGEPHFDANYNVQVNVANVIIVFANHAEDANICEEARDGVCRALSVQPQIWDQGPLMILRDGQVYEGGWRRANRGDMLTFYDHAGHPIPLQLGNSWVQVVPTFFNNPVNVTN